MRKILSIILAVAMLATLFVGCDDQNVEVSDAQYITDKGEMIIGITLFAPMNYYDNTTNELIGFETEFAEAVCEKVGVTPNFVEIDWNSKEIELNAKNIDCIWNGMTITDERKENMEISNPYMKNRQVMVVKAENLEGYTKAVGGSSVVAEAGSAGEELATTNDFFKDTTFTPVDSMAKALMDVKAGTSDIAIVDYVTSIGSIGEGTEFEDLVTVEAHEFSPEEYGIAFRKGSDMAAAVNEAIAELIAEGKLDEIAAKYKLENLLIKE